MNDQTFNKYYPTAFTKGEHHFIMTPSGDVIQGMLFNRVTSSSVDLTYAIVKMLVNIAENEEEARKLYGLSDTK